MQHLSRLSVVILLCLSFGIGLPAYSEISSHQPEVAKTVIENRLNRQLWYGMYLDKTKVGYAWELLSEEKYREKIQIVYSFNFEMEGETMTEKLYFDRVTGKFLGCKSSILSSSSNLTSETRARREGNKLIVNDSTGQTIFVDIPSNTFTLQDYFSFELWIMSEPKIGEMHIDNGSPNFSCQDFKFNQVDSSIVKGIRELLIGGVRVKEYSIAAQITDMGDVSGRFLNDGTALEINSGKINLVREPKNVAVDYTAVDMYQTLNLRLESHIENYERLKHLKLRVSTDNNVSISNHFSQLAEYNGDNTFTVTLGSSHLSAKKNAKEHYQKFKESTYEFPANNPQIMQLMEKLTAGATTDEEKVWRLLIYVSNSLIDSYFSNSENVFEIIKNQKGDCTEHAQLFVTLARAAGFPARSVFGLIYSNDADEPIFAGHAWAEIMMNGRWLGVDPIWQERTLTPIRLQLDLLGDLLKIIDIKVVEKIYHYRAPKGIHKQADIAYDEEDFKTFFQIHELHAEKGDVHSQLNLGWAYEKGLGVRKDYNTAKKWYLKAAEQGNAEAQYLLGTLYNKDGGIRTEIGFDTFWYQMAAINGHAEAASLLAQAYELGLGVPKNQQQASEWFKFSSTP